MYSGISGWHVMLVGVFVWLIVAAALLFALYWTIRLAITHALRARDRAAPIPPPGAPPQYPGTAHPRPDDPAPPGG